MASSICKVGLVSCTYNGQDIRHLTHCIRIFESMCKPYRTAEIVVLNDKRQANALDPLVGDQVDFTIQDSWGQIYSMTSYVTALPDTFQTNSIHDDQVTIGTVTSAFMKNKASTVQWSGKNMPITSAIAAIHGMYISTPIQVVLPSLGMIATDQRGSYVASGDHPFKTIQDLCARCGYGAVQTGSTVYFENKYSAVVGPLEYILNEAKIGATLLDQDTWGTDYRHMFGMMDAEKAILAVKVYHKDGQSGGAGEQVKAASTTTTLFNQKTKFLDMNAIKKDFGNLGNYAAFKAGNHGGINLRMITDPTMNPLSTDPAQWAASESNFKSRIRDGTNFLIKTTIESGFKADVTVGNRVFVVLRAPLVRPDDSESGPLLIADWMAECYFDNREVAGTCTLRAVKTGKLGS